MLAVNETFTTYFTIHNENNLTPSVWVECGKMSGNRIFLREMHFDKLAIAFSAIEDSPINPNR